MAYPATLDNFTDPLANQYLNSPSHSGIETAQNASLRALESNIGVTGSSVATTIDYLLKNPLSLNPGHKHSYASWVGTFPASGVTGTFSGGVVVPASTITGTIPSSAISYSASSVPVTALFGTFPTTSPAVSFAASSIPSSALYGPLPSNTITFNNGVSSNTSSTTQTIAHGLGVIPKKIRIRAINFVNGLNWAKSDGVYNGSTTSTVYDWHGSSGSPAGNTDTTNIANLSSSPSNTAVATATFDATNITLVWTNASGITVNFVWEAQA